MDQGWAIQGFLYPSQYLYIFYTCSHFCKSHAACSFAWPFLFIMCLTQCLRQYLVNDKTGKFGLIAPFTHQGDLDYTL